MIEALKPKFSKKVVKVIGCGLAGAELALILANNGFFVHVFDNGNIKQKSIFPYYGKKGERSCETKFTFDYYQKYQKFLIENMEFELDCLCSPLLSIAKRQKFENFGVVYDEDFMFAVRKELEKHPNIQLFDGNIEKINPSEITVLATGHNTDSKLLKEIEGVVGKMRICNYQPQEMIIDAKSIDLKKLNFAGAYECYANLSEKEYFAIYEKIKTFDAEYEKDLIEENQITIEAIAKRGKSALRNSVLRPHFDKKSRVYGSLKMTYNPYFDILVVENFCSALDEEEQEDIINSISSLSNCKILEYSKIAKRTFLLSPSCLHEDLKLAENLYVCGGFAGTSGSFEGLLLANFCAYQLICDVFGRSGSKILLENTCISKIMQNLLKKSVIKFRLFTLKYDIIKCGGLKNFEREVEVQKFLSKSQIEKFKEKFYGKYF